MTVEAMDRCSVEVLAVLLVGYGREVQRVESPIRHDPDARIGTSIEVQGVGVGWLEAVP